MVGEIAILIFIGIYGIWAYFTTHSEKKKRRKT